MHIYLILLFKLLFKVIFPQENIVQFLLDCGANANAKNCIGSTPLHVATIPENCSTWVKLLLYIIIIVIFIILCYLLLQLVKLLLKYGAHIDQPNNAGDCASSTLQRQVYQTHLNIRVLDFISLKCLCSNTIVKYNLPYQNQIPKTLECFVKLHEI